MKKVILGIIVAMAGVVVIVLAIAFFVISSKFHFGNTPSGKPDQTVARDSKASPSTAVTPKPVGTVHTAAAAGDLAALEVWLRQESQINAVKKPEGYTPLQTAIEAQQPAAMALLLKHGADTTVKTLLGQSTLELAVAADSAEMVKALGTIPEAVAAAGMDEAALLRLAAKSGAGNVVQYLVNKGVTVDAADDEGRTALHLAARRGHAAVLELLLRRGANVNLADKSGSTPLHWAARSGRTAAAVTLLAKGAAVQVRDKAMHAPIHLAAVGGDQEMIRALLDKGADPKMTAPDGTPLSLALESGNIPAYLAMTRNATK